MFDYIRNAMSHTRLYSQLSALKEKVFTKLFKESEIAKFNKVELHEYEDSVKVYRDLKNSLDTALRQGREEGLAQGLAEGLKKADAKIKAIAHSMLEKGMSKETVAELTGLSIDEIQ